jgi:predicted CoA-binding protein
MDHTQPYSDAYLQGILKSVKTIAMVGASPDKTKFSYGVLRVLNETGYDMIPVNPRPGLEEIRGLKVYPSLAAIDRPVDMVEVFRRPEDLMAVTKDAIAIGAKVLWGQIGVVDHEAAQLAEEAGMLRPISDAGDTLEVRTFQALKSQKLLEWRLLLFFHRRL